MCLYTTNPCCKESITIGSLAKRLWWYTNNLLNICWIKLDSAQTHLSTTPSTHPSSTPSLWLRWWEEYEGMHVFCSKGYYWSMCRSLRWARLSTRAASVAHRQLYFTVGADQQRNTVTLGVNKGRATCSTNKIVRGGGWFKYDILGVSLERGLSGVVCGRVWRPSSQGALQIPPIHGSNIHLLCFA
jgi:hypothetical protein